MRKRWPLIGVVILLGLSPAVGLAGSTGEPVAVLTEIKAGHGTVQVKGAPETTWKAALPFVLLHPGDQIRATQNAVAVVMFTDGQGTLTVAAGNSPYTVAAPAGSPGAGESRGRQLVTLLSQFFIQVGKRNDLPYVPLSTRSAKQPPLILFPRDGKLLDSPVFEWSGYERARYTIRVFGSEGLVWQGSNLPRALFPYPAGAPPLSPGVAYRWELETPGIPVQQGQFTILSPSESAAIRQAVTSLDPAVVTGYPKGTIVLLRAGFLLEASLYTEARKELSAALSADPDEPSLHVLLGIVYERTGLTELAAEEFDEAQFLLSRTP